MNREEFISYIKKPASLDKSSLIEINELLEEFPYFQSGHLLFLKNLHKLDHIRFGGQLKKSAAFVANREILYRLLFDYNEPQIDTSVDKNTISQESQEPPIQEEAALKDPEILYKEKQEAKDEIDTKKVDEEPVPDAIVEEISKTEETLEPTDEPRSKEDLAAELKKRLQEIKESGKKEIEQEFKTSEDNTDDILQLSDEQIVDDTEQIKSSKQVIAKENPVTSDLLDLESEVNSSSTQDLPPESPNNNQEKTEDNTSEKKNLNSEIISTETHSFSSWLNLLNTSEPTESIELTRNTESPNQRQLEIIDKFIEDNPRITPAQEKSKKAVDIADKSVEENEGLFTETLARIYVKQGYYSKSLFIYKKLSLKFPEKSSYFAAQIKKIEDRINEL